MTGGDNPHRIGSEAALARLCGTAPIPASSGTTTRYRLHRGRDRQANSAIYLMVHRLRWYPAARAYIQRRPAEGQTKKESSAASNEPSPGRIYTALRTDLAPKDSKQPEPKINKPLPDDA
jgi:transposase